MSTLADRVEQAIGKRPARLSPLGGGCVGDVYRAELGSDAVVVKAGDASLDIEGRMLRYLKENSDLPVPDVLCDDPDLLIMTFIENDGRLDASAQTHAGQLLAALHDVSADRFGFGDATLIGGLPQPNPWTESWVAFFRDHRLLYMGRDAMDAGRLPGRVFARLEAFAHDVGRWIGEPGAPSLLHGDMWTGNVLCLNGRIAGYIDPAVYYGDAEIELAFSTLFGTYGASFFESYQSIRPLQPGFFEERRDIYNLYPLLVHVRLFGGSYVSSVESALGKFGY